MVVCVSPTAKTMAGSDSNDALIALVDKTGNESEKAFLRGDIEALAQFWTDDIISMPDQQEMIRGKEDLKKTMEAVIKSGIKFESIESTTIEAKSCGELVYEVGTFSQTVIIPNTSEPVTSKGKYLNIWQRQPDGSLKIAVEIFNTDPRPEKN